MIEQQFTKQLAEFGFNPVDIKLILDVAQPLELPTRHILVEQGASPQAFYFVLEGLCHACYLTETGKQFSKEFYWENDWIIGFESSLKTSASPFLLETLTPVSLYSIPVSTLKEWRSKRHPIYIRLLEAQLLHKEYKERFMLLYTPEDRYRLLCQRFPELKERINDYHIAAYLGITQVSLSRIKSRDN
jgi:CRP-like cAMP-binding protein